jgi:hypothetical protein
MLSNSLSSNTEWTSRSTANVETGWCSCGIIYNCCSIQSSIHLFLSSTERNDSETSCHSIFQVFFLSHILFAELRLPRLWLPQHHPLWHLPNDMAVDAHKTLDWWYYSGSCNSPHSSLGHDHR